MQSHVIKIYAGAAMVLCLILYFAWKLPSLAALIHAPTPSTNISTSIPTDLLAAGGQPTLPMTQITVGGVPIQAEVASNDPQREAGLSGRPNLLQGQGMLFTFEQPGYQGFWMKDMLFPLDLIWADSSGIIVTIWPNVPASSYPQVFHPASPALYVLELPANFAAQHGIAVGSKIVLGQ